MQRNLPPFSLSLFLLSPHPPTTHTHTHTHTPSHTHTHTHHHTHHWTLDTDLFIGYLPIWYMHLGQGLLCVAFNTNVVDIHFLLLKCVNTPGCKYLLLIDNCKPIHWDRIYINIKEIYIYSNTYVTHQGDVAFKTLNSPRTLVISR